MIALLFACLLPCPRTLPQESPRAIHVPAQGVELPLEDSGGRPVVEVFVGDEPLRLLIDTGSTLALILEPHATERLGLLADGPGPELVPELQIGDALFEDVPAIEIAALPPAWGLDGILGFPCFVGCLLTLDTPGKRLRLAPGTLPSGPGTLDFRADDALGFGITIDLDVCGVSVPVHLDTGSPELMLFSSLLLEELPLRAAPRPAGQARTPMGAAEISLAPLEGEVRLGPLVFRDPEARFGDLPQIAGRRLGNIGARFLAGARLTIDAHGRRLRIELPSATPASASAAVSSAPGDPLAAFAGSFRIEGRIFASADPALEPRSLTGTAVWEASTDGRRRHERFELDGPDGPLRGQAFLGPLGTGPALELVQVDDFQPQILHVQGAWSTDRSTIVLERCQGPTTSTGPALPALRWIYRFEEGGVIVKEMHAGNRDGTFRLASEYRYVPANDAR